MSKNLIQTNEAVSTVIAAMLILVLITTFISAINAYYIPSLASENEIQHMQEVRNSFVELASLAASGSSNEKVQIPLGSEEMLFGPSVSSSGTLTVEPNSSWINISMKNVAEPENRFDGFYFLKNLTSVSGLFLVKPENSPINTYDVIIDGNNTIHVEWDGNNALLIDSERNGNQSFYGHVATPMVSTNEYFIFDLLNPAYGFSAALKDAQKPLALNLDGSFYVEYEKLPPYDDYEKLYTYDKTINISTGCFKYRSSNNFWIDQEFIFENGAVILQQSTSTESLVRSRPFITLEEGGKILNMQIFNVVGVEDSMSGNGVSTINVQVEEHEEQIYPYVEKVTVEIGSEYCGAWNTYLESIGSSTTSNGEKVTASFYNKSVKVSTSDIKIMIP